MVRRLRLALLRQLLNDVLKQLAHAFAVRRRDGDGRAERELVEFCRRGIRRQAFALV